MTPERRTELNRLAALPPECTDIGQACRDRLDLIGAVAELLSEVDHLESLVKFMRHLKPSYRKGANHA